jgi:TP901 family phage tail tape measure protein
MAFNINAQVILSGPKNITNITKTIQQQLGNVTANVNLNIPKNAQQQLTNIGNATKNLAQQTSKLNANAQTAAKSVANVGKNTKQAASAMQVLGKETALTFKRFAAAGLVTSTIFQLTAAISSGVGKALEFERGLVKLQQITGKTNRELQGLKSTVDSLAKSLGQDANEILEIGQIFAQTGQSIREIQASITAVSRSSLAPTFGEMKQTAEGLVAALNQFGIAASESEAILGSLNRVSKRFAVESDDLIAAIRRAGGVFAISAGEVEKPIEALNQFVGVFTAVRSTTRESAETVATGLRTIFSRIQRRGTIDVLQQLGINLTDANGKFIGLFESFRVLSSELDRLVQKGDAITLSAITEELGGIRQIGKLIPAIRNFNKAEAAFREAQAGAIEGLGADVALGLSPLIKTFEQIQAKFQSLIRTISESSSFQALAKTVAGLANAFLSVSEALTPLLPLLIKFATIKIGRGIGGFAQGFTSGLGRGVGGRGGVRGFNRGGFVPGSGNRDTVPAMLTPGEFVINKSATQAFGAANLASINKYADGGRVIVGDIKKQFGVGVIGPTAAQSLGGLDSSVLVSTIKSKNPPAADKIQRLVAGTSAFDPDSLEDKALASTLKSGKGSFSDEELTRISNSTGVSKKVLKGGRNVKTRPVGAIARVLSQEAALPNKLPPSAAIVASGGFLTGLSPNASQIFNDEIVNKIPTIVREATLAIGPSFVPENPAKIKQLVDANEGALGSLAGFLFEGLVRDVTQQLVGDTGISDKGRFDVPLGTNEKDLRLLFGQNVRLPLELKNSISQTKLASAYAKAVTDLGITPRKFATGGMASGTDTVPALLTPGEFVVNKKSAQSFGYGNLKNINKYAKGGVVQRFQNGGTVPSGRASTGGAGSARLVTALAANTKAVIANNIVLNQLLRRGGVGGGGGSSTQSLEDFATRKEAEFNERVGGSKKTKERGGLGGEGALGAALLLSDIAITAPILIESFKQASDGVEGAGTQLAATLASTAISATFAFQQLKEINLKGAATGALDFVKGLSASKVLLVAGVAAITGAIYLFDKNLKDTANELRQVGLKVFNTNLGKATESLSALANATNLNADGIREANARTIATSEAFGIALSNTQQAQNLEASTIGATFGRAPAEFGRFLASVVGKGETGEESIERENFEQFAKLGAEIGAILDTFSDELAEKSQGAFDNVQNKILESVVKGSLRTEDKLKIFQTAIDSIDVSSAESARKSVFAFQRTLANLGPVGQEASKQFTENLRIQFLSELNTAAKELGADSDAVRGSIAEIFSDPNIFKNPGTLRNALGDLSADLVRTGANVNQAAAQFKLEGVADQVIKAQLASSQAAASLAQYNTLMQRSAQLIDAVAASVGKLERTFTQFSDSVGLVVGNTESAVSALLSGGGRFELDEQINPFANLDLLGSADDFAQRIQKGIDDIVATGGPGAAESVRGLEQVPQFAANIEEFTRQAVFAFDQAREEAGGAILPQGQVEGLLEDLLPKEFKGTNFAEAFVSQILAVGTKGREGTDLNLDAVRDALKNNEDILGTFADVVQDTTDSLAKITEENNKVANQILGISKLQREVEIELRGLDFKALDIQKQVGEITGQRTGSLAEAQADLNARIGITTGGAVQAADPAALARRQADLQERIASKRAEVQAREGQGLASPELLKEIGTLESQLASNTDAVKILADDTSRLAAIQKEVADLEQRQQSSRQGLTGLLGQLGQVQDRLRTARTPQDRRAALEQAQQIRGRFATVQKLQTGQQLGLTEASQVLAGDFDQLLKDLGQDPEALKKAIDQGFKQGRGAAFGALGQFNVQLPPNAFEDVNLGEEIEKKRGQAEAIGAEQQDALDIQKNKITTESNILFAKLNDELAILITQLRGGAEAAGELRRTDAAQRIREGLAEGQDFQPEFVGEGRDVRFRRGKAVGGIKNLDFFGIDDPNVRTETEQMLAIKKERESRGDFDPNTPEGQRVLLEARAAAEAKKVRGGRAPGSTFTGDLDTGASTAFPDPFATGGFQSIDDGPVRKRLPSQPTPEQAAKIKAVVAAAPSTPLTELLNKAGTTKEELNAELSGLANKFGLSGTGGGAPAQALTAGASSRSRALQARRYGLSGDAARSFIQSGKLPGAPAAGAAAPAAGGPAGGGGVAGPDVAMQNLANALNGIRDGINLNIGEVNVTITNAGELANSIKQAVIEAIGGGVNDNTLASNETSQLNTTATG